MAEFLPMLHSYNVFRRPGGVFGMPDIDNSDPMGEAFDYANRMKNEDMNRQREMMEFQRRMGIQEDQRRASDAALARNERTVFGPVNKQRIVQYAPPTQMQQKFRQDELAENNNRFKMGQIRAEEQGKLASALAVGSQRDANEMARLTAELNSKSAEGAATRTSAEKIAADELKSKTAESKTGREFTAEQNRLNRENKGGIFQTTDKDGKPVTVKEVNGQFKRVQLDDEDVGVTKPGTPGKNAGVSKEQQGTIDMATQALAEIDNNLLDKAGNLTDKAKWAVGGTGHLSKLPWPTDAAAGQASIKMVASQQVLKLIGDLKAQSRTGATGFGNMSNQDRQTLENAATKLSPENIVRLSEKEVQTEINRIRDILRATIAAPRNGGKTGPVTPEQAREKIRQFGGQ